MARNSSLREDTTWLLAGHRQSSEQSVFTVHTLSFPTYRWRPLQRLSQSSFTSPLSCICTMRSRKGLLLNPTAHIIKYRDKKGSSYDTNSLSYLCDPFFYFLPF